jgi:hypothetical protein
MGFIFGHIEVGPIENGVRWCRDLRTGECMPVKVEDINRLAERWFWRLF